MAYQNALAILTKVYDNYEINNRIYGNNRFITIDGVNDFEVYSVTGQNKTVRNPCPLEYIL